jgi:SOS response associated peptidase (SRAP)
LYQRAGSGTSYRNALTDPAADKPAFRSALRKRRCLVPADGFYEWQPLPGRKQPFLFRRPDGRPFALAGLWESWQGPDGRPLETCALLTTEANAVVRPVHDRMPVLVNAADFAAWLSPDATPADLVPLLRPAPDDALAGPWPWGRSSTAPALRGRAASSRRADRRISAPSPAELRHRATAWDRGLSPSWRPPQGCAGPWPGR